LLPRAPRVGRRPQRSPTSSTSRARRTARLPTTLTCRSSGVPSAVPRRAAPGTGPARHLWILGRAHRHDQSSRRTCSCWITTIHSRSAKRYGTLDRVCDGRLVLGVGVGSLAEEFELLDAPFTDPEVRARRRERHSELRSHRISLSNHGTFYDFRGIRRRYRGDPGARAPLWVGRTAPSDHCGAAVDSVTVGPVRLS